MDNILKALNAYLKERGGRFIRYNDGNRWNDRLSNLTWVTPKEAFRNPDWMCDWQAPLTRGEALYVHENMDLFLKYYL